MMKNGEENKQVEEEKSNLQRKSREETVKCNKLRRIYLKLEKYEMTWTRILEKSHAT